jgi:hypothetical protein
MTEPCIRCGERAPAPGNGLYCEPCWQQQAHEAHETLRDLGEDAVSLLMKDGGLSFVEAVERLAGDRGLSGEADP